MGGASTATELVQLPVAAIRANTRQPRRRLDGERIEELADSIRAQGVVQPVVVPILRAGLGMVEGILRLVPSARVGHIGLYRDHDTLEPVDYYFKVPADVVERDFFVLDPMLATGWSAVSAITSLKRVGATRVRFLCLVAAPEGVRRLEDAHPDVPVYCAALDRELNAHGYILPGLGDAGDRLFGTR